MIDARSYDSLGDLLRDAFVQFKSDVALIERSRRKERARYTYLEAKRAIVPVARHLQDEGLAPGDRVAILMTNQSKWLLGASAALVSGATLVPLDYKLTPDEQAALLAHAKPRVLFIEYGIWKRFSEPPDVPLVIVTEAPKRADVPGRWETIPAAETYTHVSRTRDDVACIVYSSGTGGTPKGCLLTHGNYLSQWEALAELYPMTRGDRFFSILPTNHAIDFMTGFIGPFACGGTVVHQRTLRPEFLLDTMKAVGITHMAVVPLLLEAFERRIREQIDEIPPWKRRVFDGLADVNRSLTWKTPRQGLSRRLLKPIHDAFGGELKVLFCGGAFVEASRAEFFYRLGLPVVIGYGLTEACTVVSVNDLKPFRADSVGGPVRGVHIRVVDAESSGVGRVQVRGPTVMKGYLDAPELTEAAFDGDWLETGDLGWLDASGHLHLVGRSKNMIVTAGGKNVYPEDIEGAFSAIACEELAVFATRYVWPADGLTGETLLAVVRPQEDLQERTWLADLQSANHGLPEHKRIHHVLVWGEPFPRTASMKLKRQVLAESLRSESTPDSARPLLEVR